MTRFTGLWGRPAGADAKNAKFARDRKEFLESASPPSFSNRLTLSAPLPCGRPRTSAPTVTWGRGFDRIRSECAKEGVPPPIVAEKDGCVRLTFARSVQLSQESVQLSTKNCTEVGKKSGQEVSQKREKISQKRGKELSQKAEELSQKREEVSQKQIVQNTASNVIKRRVNQTLETTLPSLRLDLRRNTENVLLAIGMNVNATIREISQQIGVSQATVKNIESLLKEVGILYRVGADRGGHWLISWKGAR